MVASRNRRRIGVTITALALVAAVPLAESADARRQRPRRPLGSVCLYSHTAMDDPIVKPGEPGASHSHDFFGNTTTDAFSTVESLTAGSTTCRIGSDRSAYWAPTMYSDGVPVVPVKAHAYYVRKSKARVVPPPLGLRIVAGGDRQRVRFGCVVERMPSRLGSMVPECGDGLFTIGITFPDCWNGVDLDSPDHRSHMAYSTDGRCPSSHPVATTRIRVFFAYPRPDPDALLTLSSGDLSSAHADFFNAWDPSLLAEATEVCLNAPKKHDCAKRLPKVLRDRDEQLAGNTA